MKHNRAMFSKAITPILLLIGAIIVLLFFIKTQEGFDGTVPTNPDTSSIPAATPGATTSNPTTASPYAKDIEAVQASLRDLKAEYEKNPQLNGLSEVKKSQLLTYKPKIAFIEEKLQGLLAEPTTINLIDFDKLKAEINKYITMLRNPESSSTATSPNTRSIAALISGLQNVKEMYNKNPELIGVPADKKEDALAIKQKLPIYEKRLQESLADPTKLSGEEFIIMMSEIQRSGNILQRSGNILFDIKPNVIDVKEVQATLDALRNLKTLMLRKDPLKTNLPIDVRNNIVMMRPQFPALENRYNAALASPNTSALTTEGVREARTRFESYYQQLNGAATYDELNKAKTESAKKAQEAYSQVVDGNAAAAKAGTKAGPVSIITKPQLTNLQIRIRGEIKRLANLRSRSATMITRKAQLEKLLADVTDIISAVDRKAMKLEDVPIRPEDADNFLKTLASGKPLATLIVPKPKTPANIQAKGAAFPSMTPQVQQLLEQAKYLKWDLEVKLSYDPKMEIQDRALKLLESLEKKLTAAAISDTPIPPQLHAEYMNQLQNLQSSLDKKSNKKPSGATATSRLPSTYSRAMNASKAEYPNVSQMLNAQGARSGPRNRFPDGQVSPDVYIRPGFVMNDATIARRASSSAFDSSVVGGPDYKKRALDLCRQVKSAQLGDPESFGCIANPDAVSSGYSWKGNYQMVCNRLGDTWGGWYPEMFGCPKYDPTDKFRGTML